MSNALGTDGANIPEDARHGGMTVKFVQSSDNKYIQARCMAQNFTTDVSQWQGVDDEPTAGSKNLVTSGGVATGLANYTSLFVGSVPFATSALKTIGGDLKPKSLVMTNFVIGTSYIKLSFTLTLDDDTEISFATELNETVPTGIGIYKLVNQTTGNYLLLSLDYDVHPNLTNVSYSIDVTKYKQSFDSIESEIESLNGEIYGGSEATTVTEFTDTGKFLYNQSTLDSAQYNITTYLDIEGATKLELTDLWASTRSLRSYVFYDSSKGYLDCNPLPSDTGLQSYTILASDFPQGAKYIRCTENTVQGTPSIKIYKVSLGIVGELENVEDEIEEINKTIDEEEKKLRTEKREPQNLIKNITTYSAQHLNTSDGTLLSSASFTTSDFVEIEGETEYASGVIDSAYGGYKSCTMQEVCFYDASKTFIPSSSQTSKEKVTSPEGAKFLRFSVLSTSSSTPLIGIDDMSLCEIVEGDAPISVFADDVFKTLKTKSPLYGKKWLLLGDSNTHHNARASAKYDEFIAAEAGVVPTNIGVSGAGFRVYNNTEFMLITILNNFYANNPTYKPDFITIMAGSNDIVYDTENIGTYQDTTNTTVFGCMYLLTERIKEIYPNVPFAIITPFQHAYKNQDDTEDVASMQALETFVPAQLDFCKLRNIPCLDLYTRSGIRPTETAFNQHYFSSPASPNGDGLHLNYFGQKLITPRIREFIMAYFGE